MFLSHALIAFRVTQTLLRFQIFYVKLLEQICMLSCMRHIELATEGDSLYLVSLMRERESIFLVCRDVLVKPLDMHVFLNATPKTIVY